MFEEEIIFDFNGIEEEESKANALMQWLVNRAFCFDKVQYTQICADFTDTPAGAVAYEMACMIGTFAGTKFYVPRKALKKCRFYAKNDIITPISNYRYKKLANKSNTIVWDTQHMVDNPTESQYGKIFFGITLGTVTFLATTLYGWIWDKKEYIKVRKDALKAAKKEMKEQIKEAKRDARNNSKR